MQLIRSARWLMPALLLSALPAFCHAQLFKSSALHLLPAVAQPQAQPGTPPSTTPPANKAPKKQGVPKPKEQEPTTVAVPPPPTDPQANEPRNKHVGPVTGKNERNAVPVPRKPTGPEPNAPTRKHEPVTVKNAPNAVPPPPPTGTVRIPTKPIHGEDNPTALPTRQGGTARTGPCPPRVVCADSGPQSRAVIQAHPVLPQNQTSAPGRFTDNDQLPHRQLPNSASWSREDKKQFYASSDLVRARIEGSEMQGRALLAGVRSNNTDQVRSVLLRNGFTEQQLAGARFVFHDNTGGRVFQGKIKIEISPDCCPLALNITLTF